MAKNDAKDALAVIPWYWRDWRASRARAFLISDPPALMAYRELLDAMWGEEGCFLPSDDENLAALAGLPIKGWMRVREKVLRFLSDDGKGRLTHPRSQHEYGKAVAYRDGCRAGGKKTAAKRWGGHRSASSPPIAKQPVPYRTPSPTPGDPQKDLPGVRGGSGLGAPPAAEVRTEPKPLTDAFFEMTPEQRVANLARITAEREAEKARRASRTGSPRR